jgi:hypothetical protein
VGPRYPVFVISKGRADECLTARCLSRDGVPFHLVVEPPEVERYRANFGAERVLVLPFADLGLGSIPARNWVWEQAAASGFARHWILDDNISEFRRLWRGRRIPCASGPALAVVETFVDRYENVAVAGLAYQMFAFGAKLPAYYLNVHVYSCLLILNCLPQRWRGRYNEDTDLCLQVLSAGWCTVLVNAVMANKMRTMTMAGGNTDDLYAGDGRLRMARSIERAWPYVVSTGRRWKRPQHVVRDAWARFDTPLRRRADVDFSKLAPDEHGMRLTQVAEIKSPTLREAFERRGEP